MRELVERNATAARELIAEALKDQNAQIQRRAAEWLARYGDRRGLDWEAQCVANIACNEIRSSAVRMLGNSREKRYAPLIRSEVERILRVGIRAGKWEGSADNRAMLRNGTIALARIGRPEDRDLVLDAVRLRPDSDFLEALGYVDDRRSREILWSKYRSLSHKPSCSDGGLGVPALLPLSRLGEERAILELKEILRGTGLPPDPWPADSNPSLCADRAQAFRGLRPRDAIHFADTVLEIAGQDPEGPGTFEAWHALGIMRPAGFGQRVLKLAMTRRPHWRLVSRQMLNKVVLAIDPELHDEFWASYDDLQVVTPQLGMRTQIKEGLGYLLFSGTGDWSGE
jgi:hypothetical protein